MWLIFIIFISKNGEKNHKNFVYILIFLKKIRQDKKIHQEKKKVQKSFKIFICF